MKKRFLKALQWYLYGIAGASFLLALPLFLKALEWSSAGFLSGRLGILLNPDDSRIKVVYFGFLVVTFLSLLGALGLRRKNIWARVVPFVVSGVIWKILESLKCEALFLWLAAPLVVCTLLVLKDELSFSFLQGPLRSGSLWFKTMSAEPEPKHVPKVERSRNSWLKALTGFILISVGLIFCLIISVPIVGGYRRTSFHEFCKKYPIGQSTENFFRDGAEVGSSLLRFHNRQRKIYMSIRNSDSKFTEVEKRLKELDEGEAAAMKVLFGPARVSCIISFKNHKVISNSMLFRD